MLLRLVVTWLRAMQQRLNGLHWTLLLIYVLNGMVEAFPLTAFESWLQNDIHVWCQHWVLGNQYWVLRFNSTQYRVFNNEYWRLSIGCSVFNI